MQCLNLITTTRGGKNVTFPCGQCISCRVNHSQDWTFRLEQQLKVSRSAHFITLTYDDENITRNDSGHGILVKRDLQLFFKRLRKATQRLEDKAVEKLHFHEEMVFPKIKYYGVGEYGGETFRPHYHAIVYNIPKDILLNLRQIWKLGNIQIGTVTSASIRYVTKYITKVDSRDLDLRDLSKPFNVMSKGIGLNYVNDESKEYHNRMATKLTIQKKFEQRLPKYYHDKIHDPNDDLKQMEIARYKKTRADSAIERRDKREQEIRDSGQTVHEVEEAKRKNLIATFSKNNKRNKI